MIVREKISDKNVRYPNKDLVELIGHTGGEEYYEILEDERPTYDSRTHKLKRVETYTTDIGVLLPIWHVTYEVIQLNDGKIKSAIDDAVEDYIETFYNDRKQRRLVTKAIDNPTANLFVKYATFISSCEAEAQAMKDNLTDNGVLPDFNFISEPV